MASFGFIVGASRKGQEHDCHFDRLKVSGFREPSQRVPAKSDNKDQLLGAFIVDRV